MEMTTASANALRQTSSFHNSREEVEKVRYVLRVPESTFRKLGVTSCARNAIAVSSLCPSPQLWDQSGNQKVSCCLSQPLAQGHPMKNLPNVCCVTELLGSSGGRLQMFLTAAGGLHGPASTWLPTSILTNPKALDSSVLAPDINMHYQSTQHKHTCTAVSIVLA